MEVDGTAKPQVSQQSLVPSDVSSEDPTIPGTPPVESDKTKTAAHHHHHLAGLEKVLSRTVSRVEPRTDGKIVLHRKECYDELGYRFPSAKKWWILSIIFAIQCSMNFNAGVYGSAVPQLESHFNISPQVARLGQGLFLICYAFGCEVRVSLTTLSTLRLKLSCLAALGPIL